MTLNRRFQNAALAAASILAVAATSSCVTASGDGSTFKRSAQSSGMAIEADAESTWQRVRGIVQGMTSDPLMNNGGNRSFRTTIDGSETTVRVESRGSQSSAVHVTSKNPTIVQRIESALRR